MKFNTLKSKLGLLAIAASAFMVTSANAAVDVSNVTAEITGNQASIVAVGGAALLLTVAAVMFKYIRKAL